MNTEPTMPLFSWGDIPGNDSLRLMEYLNKKYEVDWVTIAKFDDGKIIKVTAEKNFLLLILNNEKTDVYLLIGDGRADKLIAKTENGKLKIYPSLHDTKAGTWKGDYMEGTWCGTGEWISPGKWNGKGRWESGILSGEWKGNGIWDKDKNNDYQGEWKGSGTLSSEKFPTVKIVTIISVLGTAVSVIGTLTGVLGLKDLPSIFVGGASLVIVFILLMKLKGKWDGKGEWTENQGVRLLTIVDGHWEIAGLKGELSGTIEECK